tara:strand:+ start:3784 stop:6315 length:2532 start_codon:yes stop_codon:yes gene_type:complete
MPEKKRPYSLADIDRVDPSDVYKYLIYEKGIPETHAVAMVNNMKYESGYDPYVQGDYMIPKGKGHRRNSDRLVRKNSDGDFVYMDYNKKGKAGLPVEQEYLDAIRPMAGGMFQHQGKRYENLLDYSGTEYVPDWQTQMDFAMTEPQTKRFLKKSFDDPESASQYFTKKWEVPANAEQKALDRLENIPNLLSSINSEAGSSNAYALNDLEKEYALPPVTVSANKYAQGGAHNINKMNKRYYATGGVNPSLINDIIGNEGFRSNVYKDSSGTPTIGYGYTKYSLTGKDGIPSWKEYFKADGTPIKEMTKEKADEIREAVIQERVNTVNSNLTPEIIESLSQEQYNSLVDLVYRNGSGNVENSGLWDVVNDGDLSAAAELINTSPELKKAGGNVLEEGDDGYAGITARNKRAASSFSNLEGSFDTTTDNIAKATGQPTAQDLNDELFGGFESAEAQQAATDAYYANRNQTGIINSNIQQTPENFQTQGTPEDEARWYAENTNQEGIINQIANDFAASQAANQLGAPYEPTAENYARLGINSNAIARQVADDYDASQEFPNLLPEVLVGSEDVDFPMREPSMLEKNAIARDAEIEAERSDLTPMTQEEIDATIRDRAIGGFIREEVTPYQNPATKKTDVPFVGPPEFSGEALVKEGYEERPEKPERRKPNLGNMDYMGMLSSLGSYAARTGPLRRALNEAEEWDEVKYPRYDPALLDATVPKRDVRDAYTTAMSTAGDQGKLDLGALALLATKQAQEVSRVEENLSNQNNQIKNQAQQLNNQITMQEMNDTAANKGAAQTMKYQILNDMGKAGEMSMREMNMMRNDANVKKMFEDVFDEKFSKYNQA